MTGVDRRRPPQHQCLRSAGRQRAVRVRRQRETPRSRLCRGRRSSGQVLTRRTSTLIMFQSNAFRLSSSSGIILPTPSRSVRQSSGVHPSRQRFSIHTETKLQRKEVVRSRLTQKDDANSHSAPVLPIVPVGKLLFRMLRGGSWGPDLP